MSEIILDCEKKMEKLKIEYLQIQEIFLDQKKTRNLFVNYYKPVGVNIFWSSNHIEYESNGDNNKILSVEEYLQKIRLQIRDIINDIKNSGMWKIQI